MSDKVVIELSREEALELFYQIDHLVMHEALKDPWWKKWLPMVNTFMTDLAKKLGLTERLTDEETAKSRGRPRRSRLPER